MPRLHRPASQITTKEENKNVPMKNRSSNTALFKFLFIVLAGAGLQLDAARVYDESEGLIVMEAENSESPLGLWLKKTALSDFMGSGYLEFTGNDYLLGPANSPLSIHFKVNRGGTYVIDLRCAKMKIDGQLDLANECYVR
jgi:hypothetical protein